MSGKLLTDQEILDELNGGHLKLSGLDLAKIDLSTRDCPVQPSSLDLSIGRVFVPPKDPLDWSKTDPDHETGYGLPAGHSIIIETAEEITLSENLSAFGFPPASLARSGLLMTNPGHVDPGYTGKLTFTMINMGRDTVSLKSGTPLVTLLIFRFDEPVLYPYTKRTKSKNAKSSSMGDVLNELSPDFANFSSRAETLAQEEVKKQKLSLELRKIYIPIFVTLATTIGAFFIGKSTNVFSIATEGFVETEVSDANEPLMSRVDELQQNIDERLKVLEASVIRLNAAGDALTIDERFDAIEESIKGLQDP